MSTKGRHFYLTLPSHSSGHIFPGNTPANFKVKLSQRILLHGEWEVALAEIQYKHSWKNFGGDMFNFKVGGMAGEVVAVTVPGGYYKDVGQIINTMNAGMSSHSGGGTRAGKEIDLKYDKSSGTVRLFMKQSGALEFPAISEIGPLLGFKRGAKLQNSQIVVNRDLAPFISPEDIFLYSDQAELQHVGNTQAPLLRVIAINSDHGDTVQKSFVAPHYVPVAKTDFDEVEIKLCDRNGTDIPFERDTVVIVVLHFKPVGGLHR